MGLKPDDAGMLSVRVTAGEDTSLSQVNLKDLPVGRYALFLAKEAPETRAALTTFDVDEECSPSSSNSEPSVGDDPRAPVRAIATCTAAGIFKGGVDGKVAVFTIAPDTGAAASYQVDFGQADDHSFVFTIEALEGAKLTAPVTVTGLAVGGGGCFAELPAPSVDAVAVDGP
jgi:hypothetical protein